MTRLANRKKTTRSKVWKGGDFIENIPKDGNRQIIDLMIIQCMKYVESNVKA